MPVEFSDKTNQLLEYIEKTYLKGMVGNDSGQNIMEKMKLADNSNMVILTGLLPTSHQYNNTISPILLKSILPNITFLEIRNRNFLNLN